MILYIHIMQYLKSRVNRHKLLVWVTTTKNVSLINLTKPKCVIMQSPQLQLEMMS